MNDFYFSKFREQDRLTYMQDYERQEAARKRTIQVKFHGSKQPASRNQNKLSPRAAPVVPEIQGIQSNGPIRSPRNHKIDSIPPKSSRSLLVPQNAELHEIEFYREQKFYLQNDIAQLMSEITPLKKKLRELEGVQYSQVESDRYYLAHFKGDSTVVGTALKQTELEQAIVRMQKESNELADEINRIKSQFSKKAIDDLSVEIQNGRRAVHQITEDCYLMSQQKDANERHMESFKMSDLYKEVQENKKTIEEQKNDIRKSMEKYNKLKKLYSKAAAKQEPIDIDETPQVQKLIEKLESEHAKFLDAKKNYENEKEKQIQEIKALRQESIARKEQAKKKEMQEKRRQQKEEREKEKQRKLEEEEKNRELQKKSQPTKSSQSSVFKMKNNIKNIHTLPATKVVVATKISEDYTKVQLIEQFQNHGKINRSFFCREEVNGKPPNIYMYVDYDKREYAGKAIDDKWFADRNIIVKEAKKDWEKKAQKYEVKEPVKDESSASSFMDDEDKKEESSKQKSVSSKAENESQQPENPPQDDALSSERADSEAPLNSTLNSTIGELTGTKKDEKEEIKKEEEEKKESDNEKKKCFSK